MRWSSQQRLLLELAFVRLCAPGAKPEGHRGTGEARRAEAAPAARPSARGAAARPGVQSAAPAGEPESPLFAPGEEITAEALQEHWPEVVERLRRRQPTLVAFLLECAPESLEGNTLGLVFGVQFHRDQMEKRREALQAFLEEQTGRRFEIRCEHRPPEPLEEPESARALKTVLNIFPGSELLPPEGPARQSDGG
jgi:hypothetical protein